MIDVEAALIAAALNATHTESSESLEKVQRKAALSMLLMVAGEKTEEEKHELFKAYMTQFMRALTVDRVIAQERAGLWFFSTP